MLLSRSFGTVLGLQSLRGVLSATTVTLDNTTFVGQPVLGVVKFLGIPFAQPPVGDLRFRLPKPIGLYPTATKSATSFGLSCPQQALTLPLPDALPKDTIDAIVNSIYNLVTPNGEDCLTINVVKPAGATSTSKLPVAVWIFGGGFEIGSTSTYDGGNIVQRSIDIGQPVVYVSMNYRLSAFGFLGGKEVKQAGVGNLGLQDQREALRWVQKYVGAFGGDPTKVTIWGESAGAISVALHMLTNGGDNQGLFRGGFMESGSPIPVGDISNGQRIYDDIASHAGCSSSPDTLACLRAAPYDKLLAAINTTPSIFSYQSLNLAYSPRVDGVFLTDTPQNLVLKGSVAKVPFVTGDCDDEGTLFSLTTLNITTDAEVRGYFKQNYVPGATDAALNTLFSLYPADITQGSPFNTGILNAITPQFKRLASIQGDIVFQAPRRFFLGHVADKQNTWAFINKRGKALPILGTFHASDLLNAYGIGELRDYVIRFTSTLDPNGGNPIAFPWPKWNSGTKVVLELIDGIVPLVLGKDTFRSDAIDFITQLSLSNPA